MNVKALTEFYFVDLLSIVCNFLAVVTAIKTKNTTLLRPIKLYVIASLIFNLTVYVSGIFADQTKIYDTVIFTFMNVFTLLECTLIFLFIRNKTTSKSQRIFQVCVYTSFCTFWFYILIFHLNFITKSATTMVGIESFTIILVYVPGLNNVIKNQRISVFIHSPEFYIFLAIISYFSYCIPHFLAIDLISNLVPQLAVVFQITNMLFLCTFYLIIRKGFNAILLKS